jgi:predicted dehydrogenase
MMLRVLVIGLGLIGKQRAQAILALAQRRGALLAGTVDPVPRGRDLYGGAPHYASIEDVPPGSYDAAIVAVPHHFAEHICLGVFASGKPVLLEKPLGLNLSQARVIAEAAAAVRLPSFVGYNYRFLPTMRVVYQQMASGAFGELRSIDMFLGHGGHPKATEDWKLHPETSGGGVLIDPGVHLLDLILTVAPDAQIEAVAATRGFWGTGIEEDFVGVLRVNRTLATVRVSLIRWVNTFRVDFVGDDGYALVEGRGGTYGAQVVRVGRRWGWNDGTKRTQKESEEVKDFGLVNDSLTEELDAVMDRWSGAPLGENQPRPASMAEAFRVAELCDAMYRRLALRQ